MALSSSAKAVMHVEERTVTHKSIIAIILIVYFTLIIDNLQKFKYILTITVFGICKETNSYYQ